MMLKPSLSILYLGPQKWTCLDRANALRRLGHTVEHIDVRQLLPQSAWVDRIAWHLGGHLFSGLLQLKLPTMLAKREFDLCYVDGGEWLTPKVIRLLRQYAPKIINYNIDDPLGSRDGRRYTAYRISQPYYDLSVVMRERNVGESKNLGAKKVLRVFMSADEVAHAPRQISKEDHKTWDSEVLFLGTWMPERGAFLLKLIALGVPLTIRGSSWDKAPEWPLIKDHFRSGAVYGDDYAKCIQCAKVNLGLLSKGNRDQHTTRSLEIPALGGLLCAERTDEHLTMYKEGEEALFWKDAEECAKVCLQALQDERKSKMIAAAGQKRIKQNKHYNEDMLARVLECVYA
jgi:spore maturation protein CgeB